MAKWLNLNVDSLMLGSRQSCFKLRTGFVVFIWDQDRAAGFFFNAIRSTENRTLTAVPGIGPSPGGRGKPVGLASRRFRKFGLR